MSLKKHLLFLRRKLFLNAIEKSLDTLLEKYFGQLNDLEKRILLINDEIKRLEADVHDHIHDACISTSVMVGDNTQKLFTAYHINSQTFLPFKRCHQGKSIVILGAGPSVKNFKPIKDAIYIGLNRAFKYDKVSFDYLFAIDIQGIKDYHSDFFDYRDGRCIKFIGDQDYGDPKTDKSSYQIPESFIKGQNVYRYITRTGGYFNERFTYHLDSEPLGNFSTVSLQAMQFALYTNPKKIYLVGIDCTTNGHFTGESNFLDNRSMENWKNDTCRAISDWKALKEFAHVYYPSIEIISVNPIGLKGLFNDLYQN